MQPDERAAKRLADQQRRRREQRERKQAAAAVAMSGAAEAPCSFDTALEQVATDAALDWPEWRANDDKVHIMYDGNYTSERVLILSGRATVVPDDGAPQFKVAPGDAVYLLYGFQCTWIVDESPLVQRYGFFGADGKEIKETQLTCDICSDDCFEESYLYDDHMDICLRCFKLDAKSAQQYEGADYQREGQPAA